MLDRLELANRIVDMFYKQSHMCRNLSNFFTQYNLLSMIINGFQARYQIFSGSCSKLLKYRANRQGRYSYRIRAKVTLLRVFCLLIYQFRNPQKVLEQYSCMRVIG